MIIFFKKNEKHTASPNFTWLHIYFLTALYFHISIPVFCTLFICLVFDGLLQSIYFRMFCSKHSITFENMYLISSWFHYVDIFCIKLRCCETYAITSSVLEIYWLKHSLTLELLNADLPSSTYFCFRLV